MRLALALVLLTACGDKETTFDNIVPGGGGGGTTGSRPDAPTSDGADASTTISGHVCLLLTNQQTLTSCATTGAGNLTVTLGTATAMTADDGAFTLTRPASTTGLNYLVTGTNLKTSLVPFSSTITSLPAINTADYEAMTVANNTANPGTTSGALFVQIKRGTSIVTGATVESQPAADAVVLYDGTTSATWTTTATSTYGVAWLSSISATSTTLTVTSNSTPTMFANIPLQNGAITYVFAEIP